jgi:hypothetical protein
MRRRLKALVSTCWAQVIMLSLAKTFPITVSVDGMSGEGAAHPGVLFATV